MITRIGFNVTSIRTLPTFYFLQQWASYIQNNGTNECTQVPYVYWTVHHPNSSIKWDQLDVTCFFISLFNAQHVSDVNTSIIRCLRLICWVISLVVLLWYDVCWCYFVVWLGWCGIRMQAEALLQPVIWYQVAGLSTASACILIPHHPRQTTT